MTKYLYDFLCHKVCDSASREMVRIKDEYPMLYDDVLKWTYNGKTMAYYEELRKQYVAQIRQTVDTHMKEVLRIEAADLLMHAGRWYAFQLLFEEAYKERFANEVVINMIRSEKFNTEDIERVLPYVSRKQIEKIEQMLKHGIDDWEVITNG